MRESQGVKIIVSECCVLTTRVSGVCARYAEPCLFTHAPSHRRPPYERTKPGWSLNHDMCLHKGRGGGNYFVFKEYLLAQLPTSARSAHSSPNNPYIKQTHLTTIARLTAVAATAFYMLAFSRDGIL